MSKYKRMKKSITFGSGRGCWGEQTSLYVIWDGKPRVEIEGEKFWYYKIGISNKPGNRLKDLKTALPRARIVWTCRCHERIEDVVHIYIKKNTTREKGPLWWDIREWFWIADGFAHGKTVSVDFEGYIEALVTKIYEGRIDSRGLLTSI